MFAVNKSPGFDVYESGASEPRRPHGNAVYLGLKVNGLIGRTLRDRIETQFLQTVSGTTVPTTYDPTGVAGKASDWIVDGDFDTSKGFYGYTRYRLDADTLHVKEGGGGFSLNVANTLGTVRYIVNNTTPVVQSGKLTSLFGPNYQDLQFYSQHFFTKNWGVAARLDRDLILDKWRRSTLSLLYRNDCIGFDIIYQRDDTVLNTVNGKPQSAVFFRLNFPTFGSSGAKFTDVR